VTLEELDACSCDDCGRLNDKLRRVVGKMRAEQERQRRLPIDASHARVRTANDRCARAVDAMYRVLAEITARVALVNLDIPK